MKKKKALLLINPAAGTGKAAGGIMDMIVKIAQNGYDPVVYPVIPGTDMISEKILAEHDGEADLVLCSGGDGTLNHVVQGVMQLENKPVVAYIPAGSTNDFAQSLHIPFEFSEALDIAVSGSPFTYDIGCINGRYFNYVAAFGAFSAVSYATKQELKNVFGHAAYILTGAAELYENLSYSCHMVINADGEVLEDDYIFGAVCNTVSVGGMKIQHTDNIMLNDGKMELLLIRSPKNLPELHFIISDLKNGILNSPYITSRQVSSVHLSSGENTAWSLDGEFGGSASETQIDVIPGAVTIMTEDEVPAD